MVEKPGRAFFPAPLKTSERFPLQVHPSEWQSATGESYSDQLMEEKHGRSNPAARVPISPMSPCPTPPPRMPLDTVGRSFVPRMAADHGSNDLPFPYRRPIPRCVFELSRRGRSSAETVFTGLPTEAFRGRSRIILRHTGSMMSFS